MNYTLNYVGKEMKLSIFMLAFVQLHAILDDAFGGVDNKYGHYRIYCCVQGHSFSATKSFLYIVHFIEFLISLKHELFEGSD